MGNVHPSQTLIDQAARELRAHAPFDAMDAESLAWLASRLSLRYFARNDVVCGPESGVAQSFFIVQKGRIEGRVVGNVVASLPDKNTATNPALCLGEGESFPIGALIAKRTSALRFVAEVDTFCYVLSAHDFAALMARSGAFRDFATQRLATLLDQSRRTVQNQFGASAASEQSLARPLREIVQRTPITHTPETPIRTVLETMRHHRIGCVVIVDATRQPVGIFTERDVLDRVALGGLDGVSGGVDQRTPIETVMTPSPFSLPASAPVLDAARAMTERRFRHVLVMEEDTLLGLVSERDLFHLHRLSLGEIAKRIEQAADVHALEKASADIRKLAAALLAQGVGAEPLTQLVTTLNDATVGRALALAAQQSPPAAVQWCWLGLGSEGRMEQTLSTDQDNALIFASANADSCERDRAAMLAFATVTNEILNQCGFPLCTGDIMAKNPRWCLSLDEWKATFAQWLKNPQPEALMNAAIFFDFRALHGDASLADNLRDWLNVEAPTHTVFFRHLAENALKVRPPLGLIRDFVADDQQYPGTLDIKQLCARPFIDAARVFALQHRLSVSNTADRLRLAGERMHMPAAEVGAMVDAFHFVQLLRLRNQIGIEEARSTSPTNAPPLPPNRVDPNALNPLDRRILKEALRQARKLQTRLELDFIR